MTQKKATHESRSRKPSAINTVPEGLSGIELDIRREERLKTVEILQNDRIPLTVIEVSNQGTAIAEKVIADAKKRYPPPTLACKEGCDWCCYLKVGTTVPEVYRIVHFLQQSLSSIQLQEIQNRVNQLAKQRQDLKTKIKGNPRLPCVFLNNKRCMIYPVRPLTCRGANSTDERQCEKFLDPRNRTIISMYVPQHRLATFVLDGMRAGLQEAGLTGDLLELTAALRICLEVPDALERWLAGEPVFAPARLN
jgi:Fe-S-cluster containining protein